ncbi:unnamed protein product [Brassica napus]|uniref:(rape) hypothetical protein n=1 Tax=Brassica napus TaxID=3708 RepID=A0A816K734_BRANA|nr:unnamed protein product [Brassica napus]
MGDLAIEKLQLEAAQLEVEAATMPENENSSADCIAEVKSEVGRLWSLTERLWSLTERLLENAGIADGAASTCINGL